MTGDPQPTHGHIPLNPRLDVEFALQAGDLGVWELDPATRQVLWDDRCRELFGLAGPNPLPYEQAVQYIHPEDVSRVNQAMQWAMNPQSDGRYDQTYRTIGADDGRLRWVRFFGKSYFSPAGELARFAGIAQDVTQQVEAQQRETALRDEAQRQRRIYEAITASMPDLMYVFDLRYRFTYANQALLDMWGSSWEQSIGKGLLENGYEPWHAEMHEREIDQVVATKQPIRGEVSFPHARLGRRIYDYVFAPVFNEQGEVEAVAGTTRDITDIKLAQERMRESENRFRSLIEEAPVATMLMVGPEYTIEVANQAMIHLLGRDSSIVGQPAIRAVPELASQVFLQLLNDVFATGKAYEAKAMPGELVINGVPQLHYFDFIYKPLRDPAGQVYGIISMATDVTEQVQVLQRKEESQRQLLALFEQSPVALATYSVDGAYVIQWANPFFGELVARPPQALVGQPLLEALPELKGQGFEATLQNVVATGTPFVASEVAVGILRNGQLTTIYVDLTYQLQREADGTPRSILVVAIDVTQRVQARRKLEEREIFLQSIIDLAEIGVYTIDLTTNQLTKSPRVASWYGLPEQTDVATSISVIDERDRERVSQVLNEAVWAGSSGYSNLEYGVVHALTGQKRVLRTTGQIIHNADGQPVRVNGSVYDITSQRTLQLALEEQVQQRTQQLQTAVQDLRRSNENLQQFAYIASHDLQEPLRKIQSFGDILKTQYEEALGEGADFLERMQTAASRMSTLIKDLLAFSRISTLQEATEPVALNAVVQDVLLDLDLRIAETGARVEVEPLPTLLGDASQLRQLFQNLLGNALKFRRPQVSPVIKVSCHRLTNEELPPSIRPTRAAAAYYQIEVADNGIGFDNKYVDRIFQVFQRLHNKSEYAGTGIGLAICEKVVINHGGAITASSQPGQGATFRMYFPADERAV